MKRTILASSGLMTNMSSTSLAEVGELPVGDAFLESVDGAPFNILGYTPTFFVQRMQVGAVPARRPRSWSRFPQC